MKVKCSTCNKEATNKAVNLLDQGWRAIPDRDFCPKCAKHRIDVDRGMTMYIYLHRLSTNEGIN